jgi:hypothetical protein
MDAVKGREPLKEIEIDRVIEVNDAGYVDDKYSGLITLAASLRCPHCGEPLALVQAELEGDRPKDGVFVTLICNKGRHALSLQVTNTSDGAKLDLTTDIDPAAHGDPWSGLQQRERSRHGSHSGRRGEK